LLRGGISFRYLKQFFLVESVFMWISCRLLKKGYHYKSTILIPKTKELYVTLKCLYQVRTWCKSKIWIYAKHVLKVDNRSNMENMSEWVSDCCSMPNEQFFSYIMERTCYMRWVTWTHYSDSKPATICSYSLMLHA
jgi:hypothetical protein